MPALLLRCAGTSSGGLPLLTTPLPRTRISREKAKGVTFFEAHDSEAIRPMLDVSWAPLLGAFSVLFEEQVHAGAGRSGGVSGNEGSMWTNVPPQPLPACTATPRESS